MKIIFLDIDGVLNHQAYYESERWQKNKSRQIDPNSMTLLNGLIETTQAKIVVSSTWRIGHTIETMQKELEENGFKGEVIGLTESMKTKGILRGNEILRWLEENFAIFDLPYWSSTDNNKNYYIILDDDNDFLLWQKDNFIHIDNMVGITLNTIFKAEQIFSCT